MAKVILYVAHTFECPVCQKLNVVECVPKELTPQEVKEYAEINGGDVEDYQPGSIYEVIDTVQCGGCEAVFDAEYA